MLNDQTLHVLTETDKIAAEKHTGQPDFRNSPHVFPPARDADSIQGASVPDKHFKQALGALGMRDRPYQRPPYLRDHVPHAWMNPAFIAGQLRRGVRMLLSTHARWINSTSDRDELAKLNGTELVQKQADQARKPCRIIS